MKRRSIIKNATFCCAILIGLTCSMYSFKTTKRTTELNLVPFPKEVEMTSSQRFSLKSPLQLHVSAKDRDLLGMSIFAEMKRAGLPEPQLIEQESSCCLMLVHENVTLPVPELPKQAGEGKSNVEESYVITVMPQGIGCFGAGEIGLYYAVQTLRQLIRANADDEGNLHCLTIRDWPSMKYRCWQDDWTRNASPHLTTAFNTLELGSELKHNMFTYYMEHQFEFKKHPKLNPKDGTLSQDELKQIVDYATRHHLIVLGNQQSFGHHANTLRIPEYAHLGEEGWTLSPVIEEVYTFLDDLYSEIMPLVPFEMFNVDCDETWGLGQGPSKALADEIGVGGVYVRHMLRVRELLKKYDKRMAMWADMLLTHPDIIDMIPKDVVMLTWAYYPASNFNALIKPFSDSGYEFFVCPGQSNWGVLLPLVGDYTVNIQNFVRDGYAHGALGMINTGWVIGEKFQDYAWHAIAWGAECSWNASKTELADFNKRIGPVLFGAKGDDFGRAIELLGELLSAPELGTTWYQRFWEWDFVPGDLPDIVERDAKSILERIKTAIHHLEITKEQATVNAKFLESFLFGAKRIELIATRMLDGLEVTRRYAAMTALDLTDPAQKKIAIDELEALNRIIENNRKSHSDLKATFVQLWNSESKPYSLELTTNKYDKWDEWFDDYQKKLNEFAFSGFTRYKQMLTNIYSYIPARYGTVGGALRSAACDEAIFIDRSSAIHAFNDGRWNADSLLDDQWNYFTAIRSVNHFLEETKGKTFDDEQFRYFPYEARFLRAYFYFELAKRYGDIPLITTLLTEKETNQLKRTPFDRVIQFIVDECDAIIPSLPALPAIYSMFPEGETGSATKGMAMALKSRALLYAASPLFNPGNNKRKWEKAARAAADFIKIAEITPSHGGLGYAIAPLSDLWNRNYTQNSELILGVLQPSSRAFEKQNLPIGIWGSGNTGHCPTQNLVDAYEMKATGLPVVASAGYEKADPAYDPQNPYAGRDPRLEATIVVNNSIWPFTLEQPVQIWQGGSSGKPAPFATSTGYYLKKQVDGATDLRPEYYHKSSEHVWNIFRYSEILLNYAEAMMEAYGDYHFTNADLPISAKQAVDKVRARTGVEMPLFPATLSPEEFKSKLRNERRVELAFEDHRFWDIRRWKIAPQTTEIYGIEIQQTDDNTFIFTPLLVEKRVFTENMYLYPVPQTELSNNRHLKQNPGW